MPALAICFIAFVIGFYAGRRAIWAGFAATVAVGYAYGILRANIEQPASHFIFDGAAAGLYLALFSKPLTPLQKLRVRPLVPWMVCLIGWPVILFLLPIQDPLIQLVGLRGQIFFVPFLLVGAMLEVEDLRRIGRFLAVLSVLELLFALLEVKLGVPRFFPHNAVDDIIYRSTDVFYGGIGHFRIPATFPNSAAYAGNMVASMPLLLGALSMEPRNSWWRFLVFGGIATSGLGVFLAASRTAALILITMVSLVTLSGRLNNISWVPWVLVIAGTAWLVLMTPRMQRFYSLQDTSYVKNRVHGSVNEGFLDVILEYPMGNGLGGGGTSIPYFLQDRLTNPIGLENEYSVFALELGIPGLLLWVAFIFWLFRRPNSRVSQPWYIGLWLARLYCFIVFANALVGTGMMTSIPQTALLMLFGGQIAAQQRIPLRQRAVRLSRAGVARLKTTGEA